MLSLMIAASSWPTSSPAGETAPPPKSPAEKKVEKKERNPLSFWDGRLVLDLEERVRGEIRENNRDFDSSINDDNDDSWLLNRFRFGLTLKPVPGSSFTRRHRTRARRFQTAPTFPASEAQRVTTSSIFAKLTFRSATRGNSRFCSRSVGKRLPMATAGWWATRSSAISAGPSTRFVFALKSRILDRALLRPSGSNQAP